MLIEKADDIPGSEITPEWVFHNRRRFLTAAVAVLGVLVGGRTLAGASGRGSTSR